MFPRAGFLCVSWFCLVVLSDAHADASTGVFGAWDLTLHTARGDRPSWVKLYREQDAPVAEFVGTGGGKNRASDVKVDDNVFHWTIGKSTYHATFADGTLKGELVQGDRRTPFTGRRVVREANLSGEWDVEIDLGDRTLERILKLDHAEQEITGIYGGGQLPESKLTDVAFRDGSLTYTVEFQSGGGQQFVVDFKLQVRGDRLTGTGQLRGTDRKSSVTGVRRRNWSEPVELISSDLSNWDFQEVGGSNQWEIVDGVLVNHDRGWNIFSRQKLKDYKLSIDVKVPPRGNSGIYLNGRYEVQVADTYGQEASKGGMGAIYGRAVPTANPSKPADQWQTFEITFVDYWATVVLNGTTIVDNVLIEGITGGALDSNESEPGPIMLQGDHGPIQYRNIVIRTVSAP